MDRNIWRKSYGSIPRFTCPRCERGSLARKGEIIREEPKYISEALKEAGLMGEVSEGCFVSMRECDFGFCGEICVVSGHYRMEEHIEWGHGNDDEPERLESYTYQIQSFQPAPHIIKIPKKLNKDSRLHLVKACELFWVDYGSCANRLRIVVEFLLDQLSIARIGLKGKRKNARLDLADRIDLLALARPGHEQALTALRYVGNLGSHEGDGDFEDILDCFELLEDAITELIESRREKLAAKAKDIIDRKGKKAP